MPLVLASASPRRQALLARLGIVPDAIIATGIDETPLPGERPRPHAERLAAAKAEGGPADAFVLAADTVVSAGIRILPKAETAADALACLRLLSGRRHRVTTAVALRWPDGRVSRRSSVSTVTFARLTQAQIEAYLATGEWQGKAGGYAIQGFAESFVRALAGSHSGVVGLPLFETAALLRGAGLLTQ